MPDDPFAHPATLTTTRLLIRSMQAADAEAMWTLKSNPEVTRQYGQEPHRTIDETRAWVEKRLPIEGQRDSIFWVFSFHDADTAIGECCLWNFDSGFHRAEVGYELNPGQWRKGVMSEVLSAILTHGFVDLGLHRIEANLLAINEPSMGLLLKLGFTHEGTLRQRHLFREHFVDQLYFGLLKDEWLARQASA